MDEYSTSSTENSTNVTHAKQQLRKLQRAKNKTLTASEKQKQTSNIQLQIREHPHWKHSQSIFGFMPMNDEPDIFPLLREVLECGKKLYLPRFEQKTATYKPAIIRDLNHDLVEGQFGILEPNPECSIVNTSHMDLTLVPGLAFDSHGWRLGRGKGFYDRLLAGLGGVRFGIAFDHHWLNSVPHETLDQKMDWIITPTVTVKARD